MRQQLPSPIVCPTIDDWLVFVDALVSTKLTGPVMVKVCNTRVDIQRVLTVRILPHKMVAHFHGMFSDHNTFGPLSVYV